MYGYVEAGDIDLIGSKLREDAFYCPFYITEKGESVEDILDATRRRYGEAFTKKENVEVDTLTVLNDANTLSSFNRRGPIFSRHSRCSKQVKIKLLRSPSPRTASPPVRLQNGEAVAFVFQKIEFNGRNVPYRVWVPRLKRLLWVRPVTLDGTPLIRWLDPDPSFAQKCQKITPSLFVHHSKDAIHQKVLKRAALAFDGLVQENFPARSRKNCGKTSDKWAKLQMRDELWRDIIDPSLYLVVPHDPAELNEVLECGFDLVRLCCVHGFLFIGNVFLILLYGNAALFF